MSRELLVLGRFLLDKLDHFSDEEVAALNRNLEGLSDVQLVVLHADDPKRSAENCVYMGEYYPVPGSR